MKNMLKKLLMASLCLSFVTGCGNENVDLDLEKIKEEIINLKSDSVSIASVFDNIYQEFDGFEMIYDFDFEELFKLNKENIESYSVGVNKETKDMYFVIKPLDGKKEEIKNELKSYFDGLLATETDENIKNKITSRKETENNGLLIYVVTNDNDKIYDIIVNSKDPLFGMLMEVNDEMLEQSFSVNPEDVEEYLIALPMMMVQSNMYIIVKPEEGKEKVVKEAIDTYMENGEKEGANYLPDQKELFENRLEKEYGGYLIYIVSNDNQKVYNTIVNE